MGFGDTGRATVYKGYFAGSTRALQRIYKVSSWGGLDLGLRALGIGVHTGTIQARHMALGSGFRMYVSMIGVEG